MLLLPSHPFLLSFPSFFARLSSPSRLDSCTRTPHVVPPAFFYKGAQYLCRSSHTVGLKGAVLWMLCFESVPGFCALNIFQGWVL